MTRARQWQQRTAWRAGLTVLLAALTGAAQPAPGLQTSFRSVEARSTARETTLTLRASAAFTHTEYRPAQNLLLVDMHQVVLDQDRPLVKLAEGPVSGYRVYQYRGSNHESVVRLEATLKGTPVTAVGLTNNGVVIHLDVPPGVAANTPAVAAAAPTVVRSAVLPVAHPATPAAPVLRAARRNPITASHSSGAPARLVSLRLEPQTQAVMLQMTPAAGHYKTFRMHTPERFVLDLEDASDALPRPRLNANSSWLQDVRVAQFAPAVVRVVLDLKRSAEPQVEQTGGQLRIALPGSTNEPSPRLSARSASMAPPRPSPLRSMTPVARPIAVLLAASPQPVPSSPPPRPVAKMAQPIIRSAPPTPTRSLPAAPLVARPIVSAPVPSSIAPVGVVPAAGAPRYTGERITLNLKNADLKDFFRLIHEISGLNIVLDPAVSGTVTLVLQDVPWDQALDIVLRNNRLGKQLDGNVLRIATLATLEQEAKENAALIKSSEAAEPIQQVYRTISYAKADDLVKTLEAASGATGSIRTDPRTNTLIIEAPASRIARIDDLLSHLDRKTPQVEVEARVVSASRNFTREVGVQLGFGTGNSVSSIGGVPSIGTGQVGVNNPNVKFPTVGSGLLPLVSNLAANAASSGLMFINATNSYRIDAILTAAENRGLGKVLSRPRIVTQNNKEAIVQQGVKIPIQTTVNNTISIQFFNVTLKLTVTPQITADGTVFLNVDVENDQIDAGIPRIQGVPAIDTQQATTNVLVGNGATVVIGGVMVNSDQTSIFQVPVLGSLPVIGNLFKHHSVTQGSQELLFFITPRIVS
ncbi:MAG: type IV pilus secretin PilQ [Terriglobales bacterium]